MRLLRGARMDSQTTLDEARGISTLLYPLGNEKRILILETVAAGQMPRDISKKYDIPRSTVQAHLNVLIKSGLVVKRERKFYLTPLGTAMLDWVLTKVRPCSMNYLQLIRLGKDLSHFQIFPEPLISKLSVEEEGRSIKGLEILKELDREWVALMGTVKRVFEDASSQGR